MIKDILINLKIIISDKYVILSINKYKKEIQ